MFSRDPFIPSIIRSSLTRKAVELVYEVRREVEDLVARGMDLEAIPELLDIPHKKAVFYALDSGRLDASTESSESDLPLKILKSGELAYKKLINVSSCIQKINNHEARQVARMAVAYVLGSAGYDFSYLVTVSLWDALREGKLVASDQDEFADVIFCWACLATEVSGLNDELRVNSSLYIIENGVKNFNKLEEVRGWSRAHLLLPMFYYAAAKVLMHDQPQLALGFCLAGLEEIKVSSQEVQAETPSRQDIEDLRERLQTLQETINGNLVASF